MEGGALCSDRGASTAMVSVVAVMGAEVVVVAVAEWLRLSHQWMS